MKKLFLSFIAVIVLAFSMLFGGCNDVVVEDAELGAKPTSIVATTVERQFSFDKKDCVIEEIIPMYMKTMETDGSLTTDRYLVYVNYLQNEENKSVDIYVDLHYYKDGELISSDELIRCEILGACHPY